MDRSEVLSKAANKLKKLVIDKYGHLNPTAAAVLDGMPSETLIEKISEVKEKHGITNESLDNVFNDFVDKFLSLYPNAKVEEQDRKTILGLCKLIVKYS